MGVTQKVGALGEELTVKFLMKRGYKILERNYRRPWGELDIVAERKGKIHFIEVKSVSGRTLAKSEIQTLGSKPNKTVTHETLQEKASRYIKSEIRKDDFRAEDNVGAAKVKRLGRIIQTYLSHKHVSDETEWQCDVATVVIDTENKKAEINLIEEITL